MRLNKKGSIYIEASIVLPLSCLIVITMITISVSFYNVFLKTVMNHKEEILQWMMSEGYYVRKIIVY